MNLDNENLDHEKLRQAYLDGELSASEISAFEKQLGPGERDELAAEKRLECALADRLGQPVKCPELVWRRTQAKLGGYRGVADRYRRFAWGAISLAAAASLAFLVSYLAPALVDNGREVEASPALVLRSDSVEDFQRSSMTEPGHKAAAHFLRNHGIDLQVDSEEVLPMAAIHHDIWILGARMDRAGQGEAGVILFACCGYPMKITVAERGTPAAKAIGSAAARNSQIQATRLVGGYIAAVVGDHPAHNLLDIFAGQREM